MLLPGSTARALPTAMTPRDPIEFELFKNAVGAIANEMALTIVRTAYSGVLKNNMDFATALADADGRLVAQGLTLPGHLGSIPTALEAVLRRFGDAVAPGDVFVLNDPFAGGMHLPDVFLFKPIFLDGARLGFAATVCHHADVGGRVAGSNASDSTEIYQEGLRIPPVKLYARGERDETLARLIEANVRLPAKLFGDLRAQLSACHVAERQVLKLVAEQGVERYRRHLSELIAYSERMTRAEIGKLPDGVYTFEDWIDDDGIDVDRPIPLKVTITKRADRLTVDWTGSSTQVRGAINNTLSYTKAATYTAILSVLSPDLPINDGVFRAIEVIAPEGTIANAMPPAACAARGLTGFRMVDCCFGALAMMLPERVFAASEGGNTGVTIAGYRDDRSPFIYVDFTCGTWGGRPWADGLDGCSNLFVNMASQSVEVTEAEHPIQLLAYEFVRDRAGAGKYRGGVPTRRDYRLLEREAVLQIRADRQTFRPYGLYGGLAGSPSANAYSRGGAFEPLPGKLTMTMRRDEIFRHEIAGGGGWGDPLEREPERVLADLRNEFIS
ncbi:MAG TPA: hydantoinase B/oxoprolinase family protein, partial [Kiloniellales bacterium]|nr:hydantoinase B/oxoprolinase family protein [Kiloniellales bacterium]